MCAMCAPTVLTLMNSRAPISRLVSPSASSDRTSASRVVRPMPSSSPGATGGGASASSSRARRASAFRRLDQRRRAELDARPRARTASAPRRRHPVAAREQRRLGFVQRAPRPRGTARRARRRPPPPSRQRSGDGRSWTRASSATASARWACASGETAPSTSAVERLEQPHGARRVRACGGAPARARRARPRRAGRASTAAPCRTGPRRRRARPATCAAAAAGSPVGQRERRPGRRERRVELRRQAVVGRRSSTRRAAPRSPRATCSWPAVARRSASAVRERSIPAAASQPLRRLVPAPEPEQVVGAVDVHEVPEGAAQAEPRGLALAVDHRRVARPHGRRARAASSPRCR